MVEVGTKVKAKFGQFIVLGFRNINGKKYAQVKEIVSGKIMTGEIALPVEILSPAEAA